MVFAFMSAASPYVSVAEAKASSNAGVVHVVGDLDKASVRPSLGNRTLAFNLRDETGDVLPVLYSGPPPANLGSATKVVAIGQMSGTSFKSDRLLIKCPSKYEGETPAQ